MSTKDPSMSQPRHRTPDDLASVRAEVLLLVGDEDVIAGPADSVEAALSSAATVVISGLDHVSTPRSPAVQTNAERFLAGTVAADVAAG